LFVKTRVRWYTVNILLCGLVSCHSERLVSCHSERQRRIWLSYAQPQPP